MAFVGMIVQEQLVALRETDLLIGSMLVRRREHRKSGIAAVGFRVGIRRKEATEALHTAKAVVLIIYMYMDRTSLISSEMTQVSSNGGISSS